ncbi:MAG TPA: ATP synthase F0 subunit C [Planctomycetota bacterium]|nr:ATP synthase F0 subunit C [Planctomycetota bacterium]
MRTKVLLVLMCVAAVGMMGGVAFADEAAPVVKEEGGGAKNLVGFGLALGLAIAAFGGALGQGKAISTAVDAVARQPEAGGRIQTMMLIGVVFIETLVIYMLLICFMWGGKV